MPVPTPRTPAEGLGILTLVVAVAIGGLGWRSLETTEQAPGRAALDEPTPAPPERTDPARERTATYIVREGDTLSSVAQDAGTTVDELVAVNDLADPDTLAPDQELVLPAGASPPPEPLDPDAAAVEAPARP